MRSLVFHMGFLMVFLWAGCGKKPDAAVEDSEAMEVGPGMLTKINDRMVRRDTGEIFTGMVIHRSPEGTPIQTVPFKDGYKHGLERKWHSIGQLQFELEWVKGRRHGMSTIWHQNGRKRFEGRYENDIRIGVHHEWGAEGKREWEIEFADGVQVSKKIVRNDDLKLAEKERKYLWDTEHHGSLMRKYAFGPLKTALQNRDAKAVAKLLGEGFTGWLPEGGKTVERQLDGAKASRVELTEKDLRQVEADKFVDWLMSKLAAFGKPPKVKLYLMTLSPVERGVLESEWNGKVKLRVWGKSLGGGPEEFTFLLGLKLAFPTEAALKAGGWLRECRVVQAKQASAKTMLMEEVAMKIGLPADQIHDNWKLDPKKTIANTGGIFACDFNRDGITDLLVTDRSPGPVLRSHLLKGTAAGTMEDVTTAVGLDKILVNIAAFADLDGDGWEDLISGQGIVYRNIEGKRFENVTARSNLAQAGDLIRHGGEAGFAVADYDRDGRVDLYIFRNDSSKRTEGSWVDGKIGPGAANQLMRNLGNWQFEDVTAATNSDGGKRSTFTSTWLDANNDNWPDLYVINEYGNGLLLVNQGKGQPFRSMELMDRAADFGSMGLTVGDFNNDGQVDIYVASMYSKSGSRVIGNLKRDAYDPTTMRKLERMVAGSQLYRNLGDLKFEPIGKKLDVVAVGWAYGPALVDLDNDGYLDIYATTGFISRTRDKPDG